MDQKKSDLFDKIKNGAANSAEVSEGIEALKTEMSRLKNDDPAEYLKLVRVLNAALSGIDHDLVALKSVVS